MKTMFFLSLIFIMLYLYNTPGMNIWVVRPFIRPLLRDQGTESVKWGKCTKSCLEREV